MSDRTEQAEAAAELFEELLNGGEPERAHRETPAGALLFSRVSKRVCGKDKNGRQIVFYQAWPAFKNKSVAELHAEYVRFEDMSTKSVLAEMRRLAGGGVEA